MDPKNTRQQQSEQNPYNWTSNLHNDAEDFAKWVRWATPEVRMLTSTLVGSDVFRLDLKKPAPAVDLHVHKPESARPPFVPFPRVGGPFVGRPRLRCPSIKTEQYLRKNKAVIHGTPAMNNSGDCWCQQTPQLPYPTGSQQTSELL